MTDHYTLMNTLQNQRDQLARFVWLFAHDEYKVDRTLAVDFLEVVQETIQLRVERRLWCDQATLDTLQMMVEGCNRAIELFNATIVAMPDAAWTESEVTA